MPSIGPIEIIVVLLIVLILFGAKRLPELGRSLGSGMHEFGRSITGKATDEQTAERPQDADEEAGKAGEPH
jgi:sec-independent protein translocase protein TatA